MLRTRSPIRPLQPADREAALEICARDIASNVFVASRILDGAIENQPQALLAHRVGRHVDSLLWANANVVPVETSPESRDAFVDRLRRNRRQVASILGPKEQVEGIWSLVAPTWGEAREIRSRQPLAVTSTPPSALGITLDHRVRRAQPGEAEIVLPAAEHMFTHEIGYPPYIGSPRAYLAAIAGLIRRGHTYIATDTGPDGAERVIFKTDIGSAALGCVQLQGVWLAPELRGRGYAVPLIASAVELVMRDVAQLVTLYVNDFNLPARAAYRRVGFVEAGDLMTVLM
ncbi:MAG: GNAT family N-acetyltransferase [Intrasporangiaceae bacterium]|nr:GNAT family N-acetyltransferase [Intrasporangiaceae bacterium]